MKKESNFSLRPFNTFGVEASAANMCQLDSLDDLKELENVPFESGRDLVLGGGSNILFAGDVPGTVYLNRIRGLDIVEDTEESARVDVAAGENWHQFVLWTLDQGYCGLENLSLIPGLAGAAPMQNIGAYGVEISELLDSVNAWDWQNGGVLRIPREDCGLSYRDSRFKSCEADRFLILSCRLNLRKQSKPRLSYSGLKEELATMGIESPSAAQISAAVIRIRQRKLPDPAVIGNAGSFFKNPELDSEQIEQLRSHHKGLPIYRVSDEITKISAAWLIEKCGWKGSRQGEAGVSEDHALVLVNHGGASGLQLLELSQKIESSVFDRFGITLEREPKIFGQSF